MRIQNYSNGSFGALALNSSGGNVGIGTTTTTQKLTVVGGSITTDNQLISTVATGTAPLSVTSTTTVSNLSADLLDGHDTSYFQTALTNPVTGTGTTNYLAKWGASSLGSSVVYDDGTNVGIGTTIPARKLAVNANASTNYVAITSSDTGTAALLLGDQSSDYQGRISYDNTNGLLSLWANATQYATLKGSNGYLGLGSVTASLRFNG